MAPEQGQRRVADLGMRRPLGLQQFANHLKSMLIVLERLRKVLKQVLHSRQVRQDLRSAELMQVLTFVPPLNTEQRLLVELRGKLKALVLSQYVRDLVHYPVWVVRVLSALGGDWNPMATGLSWN